MLQHNGFVLSMMIKGLLLKLLHKSIYFTTQQRKAHSILVGTVLLVSLFNQCIKVWN